MKNCLSFYKNYLNKIYYTPEAAEQTTFKLVVEKLVDFPMKLINSKAEIPPEDLRMTTLFLNSSRGEKLGRCPGSKGHLCCNYLTLDLYEGCPLGCSYCIMKSYRNFIPLTINLDLEKHFQAIYKIVRLNPDKPIRIGTGETGDSLFLDPLFELSSSLIEFCANFPNVWFEVKTKTNFIDHLLTIKQKGNAVIAFSLNPECVIEQEESQSFSLEERLKAATLAAEAGYYLAFHFDPIIRLDNWEAHYKEVVECLFSLKSEKIVWISLGTIRYPKNLKDQIGERPYLYDEFVLCQDGKYRYLKPIRCQIYKTLLDFIRKKLSVPIYLCMESPAVWKKVFGKIPSKIANLCAIFNNICLPLHSKDRK